VNDIRPADPGARRRLTVALLIVAAAGAAALYFTPSIGPALLGWINTEGDDPLQRAIFVLRAMGVLLALLLALPAVYCWVLALRVDAAGEFPPPDMKLVRETRVLRGDKARGRAWLLKALAIKFSLLAVVCGILVWSLAETLLR
jgi:MFS family permease